MSDNAPIEPPRIHEGDRVRVGGVDFEVARVIPQTCGDVHPQYDVHHPDGHPEAGVAITLKAPEPAVAGKTSPTAHAGSG